MRRRVVLCALVLAIAWPALALASAPDCEALAEAAAARHGIPEGVLAAIARTESGGGPRASAWPWTLNMAGEGLYLDSAEAALSQLRAVLDAGRTNVDVGCMQVNWRWHGEGFESLEQMMDPAANADYAARFLVDLWRREGTWDAAVQAYHSTDPDRGAAYLARVESNRRGVGAGGMGGAGAALIAGAAPVTAPQTWDAPQPGDRRFGAQAPLVALAAMSTQSPPQDDDMVAAGARVLPDGALPNLSRDRPATRSSGAAPDTRLARIRAGFGADIPADRAP